MKKLMFILALISVLGCSKNVVGPEDKPVTTNDPDEYFLLNGRKFESLYNENTCIPVSPSGVSFSEASLQIFTLEYIKEYSWKGVSPDKILVSGREKEIEFVDLKFPGGSFKVDFIVDYYTKKYPRATVHRNNEYYVVIDCLEERSGVNNYFMIGFHDDEKRSVQSLMIDVEW